MKPRIIPLEELVVHLEGEHDSVCYEINKAETELERLNYQEGANYFKNVVGMLSQHTIDEQRSLLGFLIERLGREQSDKYIKVMRGHNQIMDLIKSLSKKVNEGSGISIADLENLKTLLNDQFGREQTLFLQASSLIQLETKERRNEAIDRFVNEGGR